jgi:hypothetical protein
MPRAKRDKLSLQLGADTYTRYVGETGPAFCRTCGDEMGCEPNEVGATTLAEAMSGKKHLHTRFTCPNAGTNWHNQVIKLKKAINDTPSAELTKIFAKEMKSILKNRKATKIVHPIF